MEDGVSAHRSLGANDAGADVEEGSASVGVDSDSSYRRLIKGQMAELEELKRAAREASPSGSRNLPGRSTIEPPPVASDATPPASSDKSNAGRDRGRERYAGVAGIGGEFLAAVTRRSRPAASGGNSSAAGGGGGAGGSGGGGGRHGHHDSLTIGANSGRGQASGANFSSESGGSKGPFEGRDARARGSGASGANPIVGGGEHPSWWQEDHEQESLLSRRDFFDSTGASASATAAAAAAEAAAAADSGANAGARVKMPAGRRDAEPTAAAVRFARRWENGGDTEPTSIAASSHRGGFSEGMFSAGGTDSRAGPREIADEALASLRTGGRSAAGVTSAAAANGFGRDSGVRGGDPAFSSSSVAAAPGVADERGRQARVHMPSAANAEKAAVPADRPRPIAIGGGGGGGGDNDHRVRAATDDNSGKIDALPPPPPPPLKVAPMSVEPPLAAYAFRSPTGLRAEGGGSAGLNGHSDASPPAYYPQVAGVAERGGQGGGTAAGRFFAGGGSWGVGAAAWGGNDTGFRHDRQVGGGVGRGGAEEPFRSASWAEKLVTKREEQSVLVRQLERELASTVSALRDERKDKREQTEALRSKLDKARSTVRDREAELERRQRMTTTLMGELEAMRSRCDRLSASREERAEEADKAIARLREDNRELEARLRQADAAAAEARAGRAGADAERVRLERELQTALAKVTATERRAQEEAEAAAEAADVAARDLRESKDGHERLRLELEGLRRHAEAKEEAGDGADSLRAQVADLERLLATANQRCVALEARLGLLERELVEAEGGEVEARARLRWALGQLGDASNAAAAAAASAGVLGAADGTSADGGRAGDASPDDAVFRDTSRRADEVLQQGAAESMPGSLSPRQRPSRSVGGVGGGEETPVATEAQEEAKGFREPNWRSMVPVLFPPGWRDRELAAAAAATTTGAGKTSGAAAATAAAEGGAENNPAMGAHAGVDGALGVHEVLHNGSPSQEWSTMGGGGGGRGEANRDQEGGGDGRVGYVALADVALADAATAGARRRRAEGAGAVSSAEGDDSGVHSVPGDVQTALDHLTAEERSFAYLGGVETEYGEWLPGGNDDLSHYDGLEMQEGGGGASGGFDGDYYRLLEQGGHRATISAEVVREVSLRCPVVSARSTEAPGGAPKAIDGRTAGERRSQPVVGSRVATQRRLQDGNGVSLGQQRSVRVPVPRASATAPGARTRSRRSLSQPRSATTAGNTDSSVSAVSQRRRATATTTTLSRGQKSSAIGGGGGGGGGRVGASEAAARRDRVIDTGAPPQPSRLRHQGAPAPPSSGGRRVAVSGSMISTGGANAKGAHHGYGGSVLGSSRVGPRRAGRLPASGSLDASTASSKRRSAALGRSGSTLRKDAVAGHRPAAKRPPKPGVVPTGTATAAKRSPAPAAAAVGVGRVRGGARQHVSLMRRRKERSGLGSSLAASRAAAGAGGDRLTARGGGGLGGGGVNSSTCSSSSRAWRP